ncbi:TorF family putative porin [Rubritepida flocculans]|uniref:TorF family putative porin n=1 Tax=Rubritepida flocculans TaxID=182403 RepID=UPI00041B23B5|nr:TorF family putative porin [Rubritepida flocculans]
MRKLLLALAAAGGFALGGPAQAQVALGETGLTATVTATYASDYLFRGISQTRSRMAYQLTGEIEHSSGVYVGAFISNVRFLGTDARQEVDVFGGYRFTAFDTKFDFGVIGYLYPGYTAPAGAVSRLDYFEAYLKVTREIGPVTLLGTLAGSPSFFGNSGTGIYIEGGADWKTGVWDLTLGGRVGYQWIENNRLFGTPDYAWWSISLTREFPIERVGTIVAAIGYYQTSISEGRCVGGQNICGARALGSISFRF